MLKKKISFSQQKSNLSQQVSGSGGCLLLVQMLNPRLELAKIKSTPTNSELDEQVVQTEEKVRIRLSLASLIDRFHPNAPR